VARFRGEKRLDIFDQAEYHGHLPHVLDEVLAFLSKHAYLTAEFTGAARRRDVLSIPLDAIREVLINAFVHASYETSGVNFKVAFLDDRIEVESPGTLMPGVTVEDVLSGVSVIRNPTIARVYREMGLIEQWGTGIPSVVDELAERGLPAPSIDEKPGRLIVTIPIPLHRPSIKPHPGTVRGSGDGSGEEVSEQVESLSHQVTAPSNQAELLRHQADEQVSEQVVRMLTAASTGSRSRSELLAATGLSDAYLNYQRHIVPLLDAGLLARTIPGKPQSRLQRYVITEAGRATLSVAKN
jgi:predicted HTH transcriptional regulator